MAIGKMVQELFDDTLILPNYAAELLGIILYALLKFFEKSQSRFLQITFETEVSKVIGNHEFLQFLSMDPLWLSLLEKNNKQPTLSSPNPVIQILFN